MLSQKSRFYAQIHSPVSEGVVRVEFSKGDKVRELVEVVLEKWGVSNREGWFPALIESKYSAYQLQLEDEIPTDVESFVRRHKSEFAWSNWDAEERGLKEFRQFGDLIDYASVDSSQLPDETNVDWSSDDIHIAMVTMITGG